MTHFRHSLLIVALAVLPLAAQEAAAKSLATHSIPDALSARLAEADARVKQASSTRNLDVKKLKSATSLLTDAQTQLARAQAELNSANANYCAHSEYAPGRARDGMLNRIQQDIDRAHRHVCEARDYCNQKAEALKCAERELCGADECVEAARWEQSRVQRAVSVLAED